MSIYTSSEVAHPAKSAIMGCEKLQIEKENGKLWQCHYLGVDEFYRFADFESPDVTVSI